MDSTEKKEYSFNKNYPRDLIGYGATPPHAAWPNKARVAVQFVLNYEEGAENNVLHGDAGSEQFLSDIIGRPAIPIAICRWIRSTNMVRAPASGASTANSRSAACR